MDNFDQIGYTVVHNAISQELAKFISLQMNMYQRVDNFKKEKPSNSYSGDTQVAESFTLTCNATEVLLLYLLPLMQQTVNKNLFPTYSYSRIYYQNATLEKHVDRPSCQYSATLTLRDDFIKWPIFIEGYDKKISEVILPIGSMLVYKGCDLPHWRTKFTGRRHFQVFLHYVDQQGEYASYANDGRPFIGSDY